MILIGIVGTFGAGKGTLTEYLVRKYSFTHFSVSEFLADEAERRGLGRDRQARADIANSFRAEGPTKLMEAVYEEALKSGADRVIIDPQHTKREVEFIKEKGGIIIAVDADLPIRYERIQKRGSPKDQVTYEEFVEHQMREMANPDPNKNNLADAIEAADYCFLNNGTLEAFEKDIEKTLGALFNRE